MAGIIVELIISWLLLWIICRKHLTVLGFRPTKRRLKQFMAGLGIASICAAIYQVMSVAFIDNSWVLNHKTDLQSIAGLLRYTIVSVLYEELIFRGALLYIAIRKFGIRIACLLSAVGFGIYHWFTFNVFGNPVMMTIIFLMTALVGLSWAYAYARTQTLYLTTGLHFGWNLVVTILFNTGSTEQSVFLKLNENQLQGLSSWLVFLFQVFALPAFTFFYLYYHNGKKHSRRNMLSVQSNDMNLKSFREL